MIHRYPRHYHEYAARQHQWLMEKWYADHGIPFDADNHDEWNDETRILTSGNFQAVTKTPPPWITKG